MKIIIVVVLFVSYMATVAFCHRINSKLIDKLSAQDTTNHISTEQRNDDNSVAYVKASIPIQIFQCMQQLNILKCMKIFILQRMERNGLNVNSGNVTADFINQLLTNPKDIRDNIFDKHYVQMSETEINDRLLKSFQNFFKNREIKLHFIPGMTVKVVPSAENTINLSLKKGKVLDFYSPNGDPFYSACACLKVNCNQLYVDLILTDDDLEKKLFSICEDFTELPNRLSSN